jgi:hypothetical protein
MTKKQTNKQTKTPQQKWTVGTLLWGSHPGKPNGQYQDTVNKKGHLHMVLGWDGDYCYLLPLSTSEKDKWLKPDGKSGLWGDCGPTWDSGLKCKPGKWWGNQTLEQLNTQDVEELLNQWESNKGNGKWEYQDKYLLMPMCPPSYKTNYKKW